MRPSLVGGLILGLLALASAGKISGDQGTITDGQHQLFTIRRLAQAEITDPRAVTVAVTDPSSTSLEVTDPRAITVPPECTTPESVLETFQASRLCNVSPCLYGVATVGDDQPVAPYPKGFAKAWVAGQFTIETMLAFKKASAIAAKDRFLRLVGLGDGPFTQNPYKYFIVDGCALENRTRNAIKVPAVTEWMQQLRSEYGVSVPWMVEKDLVTQGMNFQNYTGCVGGASCLLAADFPAVNNCSCSADFVAAYTKYTQLSPYKEGQTTEKCFQELKNELVLSPAVIRAALWACQDVSPLNTFLGVGFNGVSYTLPEFIIDNMRFSRMRELGVPFAEISL